MLGDLGTPGGAHAALEGSSTSTRGSVQVAEPRILELAGGVGGAKLAEGLQALVGQRLTVIVNTADDTERHGLLVCPDHDTVLYTLAGLENEELGWGLRDDTWTTMSALERYGEEGWFRLGDLDLATHIARTDRLRRGGRLTEVLLGLQRALGLTATILPMTDDPVRTQVRTDDGWLEFQDYFVRLLQTPEVREVRFVGSDTARPTPEVAVAVDAADIVVVAPSNPIVSIGPILALAGVPELLAAARRRGARIVAVSGIIGGKALKGPADRMLASLGHEPSALGVARGYAGLIDTFVLDTVDAELAPAVEALGIRAVVTDTIMSDDASRARLAGEVLAAAG
jgi:LPPG:FO 2-phospho-L-lactate transferase